MKYILLCLAFLPETVLAQAFLKKIEIGVQPDVVCNESGDFVALAKKVSKAYEQSLKSLSNDYEFDFTKLTKEAAKSTDLVVTIKLGYNDRTSISYGELFRYKTETIFAAAKTDSVVAKVETIYKDLVGISEETLAVDSYNTFGKTMSKIAVPMNTILNPAVSKKEGDCLCVVISSILKANDSNKNTAAHFTTILNNAIVFQQSQYHVAYYDHYKGEAVSKIASPCYQIKGVLNDTLDSYVLLMEYDPLLNLQSPKKVKTKFVFAKKSIDEGDYYQAIWQLNKSVYDLIENNVK